MSGRPTIKSIEPFVYVMYMLVLSDNFSTDRILKMWRDRVKFYNTRNDYTSLYAYTYDNIAKHLDCFWAAQGFSVRQSTIVEVVDFIRKYKNKNGWKERLMFWR